MRQFIEFIKQDYPFLIINLLLFVAIYALAYALGRRSVPVLQPLDKPKIEPKPSIEKATEQPKIPAELPKIEPVANAQPDAEAQAKAAHAYWQTQQQLQHILSDLWAQLQHGHYEAAKSRRNLLSHYFVSVFCRDTELLAADLSEELRLQWVKDSLAVLEVLTAPNLNHLLNQPAIYPPQEALAGLKKQAKRLDLGEKLEFLVKNG